MPLNFVKFQRGSAAAYASLKRNNGLESDSLYFIYNSSAPEEGGLLYLGDVLIGGTGTATGVSTLAELTDVNINNLSLLDGMVLQYNSNLSKWEPVPSEDLLPAVQSGSKNTGETDAQALQRIDANPLEGDIVFINNVPYIYNGSGWQLLVGQNLEDRVAALETGLQAVDGKIAAAISTANHLTYTTVTQLPTIANAVANTVYLVGDGTASGDNKYEEYLLVGSNFEKIGDFGTDLSNYVSTSTFNTTVGNLQSSIGALQANLNNYVLVDTYADEVGDINDLRTQVGDNSTTIVDEIINIHERLIWNQLTED